MDINVCIHSSMGPDIYHIKFLSLVFIKVIIMYLCFAKEKGEKTVHCVKPHNWSATCLTHTCDYKLKSLYPLPL